ncbi:MAG: cistern family PEP-CTERM protein [Hydrococcus sp. CSU_1_8]|nr:cistern family PEP-CTERM protein [Hydrococcus sp. CSU_1_8]
MKINSTPIVFNLATTGAVLFGSAIISGQFAPSASAFSLGDNGEITIYQNASDNPEGKSDLGRHFWVDFSGSVSRQSLDGLSSLALFRVDGFQTVNGITTVNLNAKLFAGVDAFGNPLPNSDRFENYRASVLGFAVDPNVKQGSASVNGDFNTIAYKGITANGGIDTEICFKGGGSTNNCNGAASGGVELGNSGEFNISFALANPSNQFTLSNFGVRYQDINSNVYGLQGASGTGVGEAVPEPLTILGTAMALGFGGLFQREFSKKQKALKLDW